MKNRRYQTGITLIEILIAVLVLSVGLAGLAGLALSNLRSTANAQFTTQATIVAEEVAEMMRANLSAYESSSFASTPEAIEKACSPATICTSGEQARHDSDKWQRHTSQALPGGIAVICMDSTPADGQPGATACDGAGLNTIKLFWQDSRNDDVLAEGETYHRYTVAVVP
jgi:type IV pilus assembly protein PilV